MKLINSIVAAWKFIPNIISVKIVFEIEFRSIREAPISFINTISEINDITVGTIISSKRKIKIVEAVLAVKNRKNEASQDKPDGR